MGNRYPISHTYNAADELTVSPNHTYTYLDTGSLYQQKSSGGTVQKTFAYTPANLLESVTHAGVQDPSEMTWDADSNRVSFTSSTGGSYAFMYDITAGIPAVIKETGGAYPKSYVREPDGSLIAMFVESYPYYYHFDALGSTRMLTDESGHITDAYHFDAWGNLLTHDPNSISQPYQYVGQLGYYTHYQDANLPLLQLGVRFYDPGTGRFTQVDPLAEDFGYYAYVSQNPMLYIDPTGLVRFCVPTKFYRNLVLVKIVWMGTYWYPIPVKDPRPGWPLMFFGVAQYDYYYKGERKWVCFDTHIFCRKRRVTWWVEWRPATKTERVRIPVAGSLPIGEGTPVDDIE